MSRIRVAGTHSYCPYIRRKMSAYERRKDGDCVSFYEWRDAAPAAVCCAESFLEWVPAAESLPPSEGLPSMTVGAQDPWSCWSNSFQSLDVRVQKGDTCPYLCSESSLPPAQQSWHSGASELSNWMKEILWKFIWSQYMSRYFPYMCRIKLWMKQPDILTDSFIAVLQFFFLSQIGKQVKSWICATSVQPCAFSTLSWDGMADILILRPLQSCLCAKLWNRPRNGSHGNCEKAVSWMVTVPAGFEVNGSPGIWLGQA